MKVKRGYEFERVEQYALSLLYEKIKSIPKDGKWREFEGAFEHDARVFQFKCKFRFDGDYLSIADLALEQNRIITKIH